MKTTELTKNEFAKFILNEASMIKHYPFDVFYDMHQIVDMQIEVYSENSKYEKPQNVMRTILLTFSDYGTHLTEINDNLYTKLELFLNSTNSQRFFLITLFFNCEYFTDQSFAIVTEYTKQEARELLN